MAGTSTFNPSAYTPGPSLIVDNLHENVTEDLLYTLFRLYGPILYLQLSRHPVTKRSTGSAVVSYRHRYQAANALKAVNSLELMDKKVRCTWTNVDLLLMASEEYIEKNKRERSRGRLGRFAKFVENSVTKVVTNPDNLFAAGLLFLAVVLPTKI